jgi:hypothetical protein
MKWRNVLVPDLLELRIGVWESANVVPKWIGVDRFAIELRKQSVEEPPDRIVRHGFIVKILFVIMRPN